MNPTLAFIILSFGVLLVMLLFAVLTITKDAGKTIFSGSGKPELMANTVSSIIKTLTQTYIAIVLIGIITILLFAKLITSAEGLPILTSLGGYVLGTTVTRIRAEKSDKPQNTNTPNSIH